MAEAERRGDEYGMASSLD